MNTAADILALCIMTAALGFVAVVFAGVRNVFTSASRARLDAERHSLKGNPYAETGISVVVCGPQSPHQIQRRLSQDYVRYEVILVTDFETDPFHRDILKRYSMTKTDWIPTSDPWSGEVRGAYRSRQGRYGRLVVIDQRSGGLSLRFNCGVSAASYEKVVCLDRRTFLFREALAVFNNEYCYRREADDTVFRVVRLAATAGPVLGRVDTAVKTALFGAGFEASGIWGGQIPETVLVPRGMILKAGGFHSDAHPFADLLYRIKVTEKADGVRLHEVNIPLAVAEDEFSAADRTGSAPEGSETRLAPGRAARSSVEEVECRARRENGRCKATARPCAYSLIAALFWSAVLIVTVWAIATDTQDALKKCILIIFSGYLASVAAASLALTGYGKIFPPSAGGYALTPYLIFNALLYPFYRLRRTMSAKNFFRS